MRWTEDDVVEDAFPLLERARLEGLRLRGVAREPGVHLPSVSRYLKSRRSLSETMADTGVGSVRTDGLPAAPVERVRVVVDRYRAALLAHRDGGRLVAGTFAGTGRTLRVAEVMVAGLLETGHSEEDAARLCGALAHFTLGLTQEQRTSPPDAGAQAGYLCAEEGFPAPAKVAARPMTRDSFDARFGHRPARLLGLG
ncbi:TetR/AcrR family transcriptional regulator C-terminal domain-containing protein [Streptomyces sp. NPDC056716]|uniref:TetR/AcrR family transcriptional regulator C-terminal domain-containing protein n=1 Tax=unclassified Streptomyces TaxID=2593676 RepID=UPI0036926AC9